MKDFTTDALQIAGELIIPDLDLSFGGKAKTDDNWIKAFNWHNEHVNDSDHELQIGCSACYMKVYLSLLEAKRLLSEQPVNTNQ